MRKAHTMKLIHLLSALGLVGAMAAGCNSGPPLQGCDRPDIAFNPCSGLCETTPFSPRCAICENDPLACDPDDATGHPGLAGQVEDRAERGVAEGDRVRAGLRDSHVTLLGGHCALTTVGLRW